MNRTTRHPLITFLAALLLAPLAALHTIAAELFIHDGDRVAFLGDSITEGDKYTTYLQAYALTRHPQWKLTFRNVGLGGDTSWLRNRYHTDETALFKADPATQQKMMSDAVTAGLGRDVLPLKPTLVTVAMGMNDSYADGSPGFNGEINRAYTPFILAETKIAEVLKQKGVRVALLTPQAMELEGPPPLLTYPNKPGYGDNRNIFLQAFAKGLKGVAAKTGVSFVDEFDPYLAICLKAHSGYTNYYATDGVTHTPYPGPFLYKAGIGDGIHPSPLGQTIQAWIILKALGASVLVSRAEINSATKTVVATEACRIEKLTVADGMMSFDRSDESLPMPIPPEAGPALKLAPIREDLNRYELRITGLSPGNYQLSIDGEAVTKLTEAEAAKGWNLATNAGPITQQCQALLTTIREKDDYFYFRWRAQLGASWGGKSNKWATASAADVAAELARLDGLIAASEAQIEKLRQPHPHHFELKPVAP